MAGARVVEGWCLKLLIADLNFFFANLSHVVYSPQWRELASGLGHVRFPRPVDKRGEVSIRVQG